MATTNTLLIINAFMTTGDSSVDAGGGEEVVPVP